MSVIMLSGGLDSLVLLAQAAHRKELPKLAITFDYEQRHAREILSATWIAKEFKVPHCVIELRGVFAGSSLIRDSDIAVPLGCGFEDDAQLVTVVPNRNMIFLSIAAAKAVSVDATDVLYGAHGGDRAVYPDCRLEFVSLAGKAMMASCGVNVVAPFLAMSKIDIVRLGAALAAPMHLAWSCYLGGEHGECGRCGACIEKREAFDVVGQ